MSEDIDKAEKLRLQECRVSHRFVYIQKKDQE
ncbi:hypothetical protein DFO69_0115 [Bacillus subtilis]|nr:hypothetical protein DFO69_0115 [Bacillus subtilis]